MEKLIQSQLKLPEHKMITDCPTHWNVTSYMLQCHSQQKPAITIMCTLSAGPQADLSTSEWSLLEEFVVILQPLEEATRELSVNQVAKIIPLLNAILHVN